MCRTQPAFYGCSVLGRERRPPVTGVLCIRTNFVLTPQQPCVARAAVKLTAGDSTTLGSLWAIEAEGRRRRFRRAVVGQQLHKMAPRPGPVWPVLGERFCVFAGPHPCVYKYIDGMAVRSRRSERTRFRKEFPSTLGIPLEWDSVVVIASHSGACANTAL